MLSRRSLLATFVHGFFGGTIGAVTRALAGAPSERARDRRDDPMTFLSAEFNDMLGIGQFILRRRLATTKQPDQVVAVLRFRDASGLLFIHWFTLSAERIAVGKIEWLDRITGTARAPSEVERGLRDAV